RYFYVGDPATAYGYYMLAPALTATANAYLATHGGGCEAQDVSGADEQKLGALLTAGIPVIVWNTMDYGPVLYGEPWVLEETGEAYLPVLNLHCQVLVGMDSDCFYLHDPLTGGACPVERARFLAAYRQLGSQAVIVTRCSRLPEPVVLRSGTLSPR
ncbi:MAG: C39 family peptidase, partial [Gemmiger sp.]